jgi:hypothetical protein
MSTSDVVNTYGKVHPLYQVWENRIKTARGNGQLVASYYHATAMLLPTLADHPKLGNDIVIYFDQLTRLEKLDVTVKTWWEKELSHTASLAQGVYHFTYVKDQQPIILPARFTFVFINTPEGWFIQAHHSSPFMSAVKHGP